MRTRDRPPQPSQSGASPAPLAAPCALLVAGVGASPGLEHIPVPLLLLLAALAVAGRCRSGVLLACFSMGLLLGGLGWVLPERRWQAVDFDRPVAAVVRPVGPWRQGDWGWLVRVSCERLRQGRVVVGVARELDLSLPGEAPPPTGRRLRVRGYLGRSLVAANDQPPVRPRLGIRVGSRRLVDILDPRPPPGSRLRTVVRQRLLAPQTEATLPALLETLVFGDASPLDEDLRSALYRLGLGHLLAVSGLHVGLLLLPLTRGLGAARSRAMGLVLVVAAPAVYVCLAGARPALLRAGALVVAWALAGFLARPAQALNAMAVVLTALVLAAPGSVLDLGLSLTFAASAGIVVLGPAIATWLGRRCGPLSRHQLVAWAVEGVSVTLAAQLATLPLTVWYFSWITPGSLVLNLVLVPFTALVLAVCLLVVVVGLCLSWLGGGGALLAGFLAAAGTSLDAMLAPYGWAAALPASSFWGLPVDPRDPRLGMAAAAAALFLVGGGRGRRSRVLTSCVSFALVVVALLFSPSHDDAQGGGELVMLDVGQGDAFVLRDREATVLVDGGGWRSGDLARAILIPALARLEVRHLDLVVVSHGDADHCRGVVQLLRFLPADEVWLGEGDADGACGRELATLAGSRLRVVAAGVRREAGGFELEVLGPAPGEGVPGNDGSLVLRARLEGHSLLLTGDVTERVERRLIARETPLRSSVLKVAHHGSRTSTSGRWLDAVRPRVALVSVGGANRYGHPAPEVLARLDERRVPVLRTDRHGRVRITLGEPLRFEVVGRE